MSMFQPERMYTVTVFDNQDRDSREQFVAVNFQKVRIPIGKQTRVAGKFLAVLENKGSYLSAQMEDTVSGQVRSDPYARWMPRFSITTHGMVDMPPVPSGGVVLEGPKPIEVPIVGQRQSALSLDPGEAKAEAKAEPEAEPKKSGIDRNALLGKTMAEVRSMCANRGIRYKVSNTKEELIELLEGKE